jgi:hypothetical protein
VEHEDDKLEQHAEVVGEHIDEARREWKSKQEDPQVPGAQPTTEIPKPSEQLPEEGPPEQVPDDTGTEDPEEDSSGE